MDTMTPQMQDREQDMLAYMKARDERRSFYLRLTLLVAIIVAAVAGVIYIGTRGDDGQDEVNEYLCAIDPSHPRCD